MTSASKRALAYVDAVVNNKSDIRKAEPLNLPASWTQRALTLLFGLGFMLFVAAVILDAGWLFVPATILISLAAVGRPLAERRPVGSVGWQSEAIKEIWRIAYEESLPSALREKTEADSRVWLEHGEGIGTTSADAELQRPLQPDEFARMAVDEVLSAQRNARDFARSKGLEPP